MSKRSSKRHTISLSKETSTPSDNKDARRDREKFLQRLSTALPKDAGATAADEDELRAVEALFDQLPSLDSVHSSGALPRSPSPERRARRSAKDERPSRHHHHRRHRHRDATSPPPSSSSTNNNNNNNSAAAVAAPALASPRSPRLPSLVELGVAMPPVVEHMLELERLKKRDEVKALLAKCSPQDRARFKYEIQRRRLNHLAKKEAAAAAESAPVSGSASLSRSGKMRGIGQPRVDDDERKERRRSTHARVVLETQSAREPAHRLSDADVIRKLSVDDSLKRILEGHVDDASSSDDQAAAAAAAAAPVSTERMSISGGLKRILNNGAPPPQQQATPPSDKRNRPRTANAAPTDVKQLSINNSLKRILTGDIDDVSSEDHPPSHRAPPADSDDDDRPPPPAPSTAPPLDAFLDDLQRN